MKPEEIEQLAEAIKASQNSGKRSKGYLDFKVTLGNIINGFIILVTVIGFSFTMKNDVDLNTEHRKNINLHVNFQTVGEVVASQSSIETLEKEIDELKKDVAKKQNK